MFLVVQGRLAMQFRDGDVELGPCDMLVVPLGVEHCPIDQDRCQAIMVAPATNLNTGSVENDRTVRELERVA